MKLSQISFVGKIVVLLLLLMPFFTTNADAQRKTDNLDRGLVGVPVNGGIYLSWRVQADEYYDVTYNVYRGGSLIATGLNTSNWTDTGGTTSNTYTVAPVRNGVLGTQCAAVTPWAQQYMEIPMADVQAPNGVTIWKQSSGPVMDQGDYQINDVSLGDVDGDGKIDFIVKRKNMWDQNNLFPTDNYQFFAHIECYASSINYGRLWWIDCGRNIVYGSDEQWDAVAFDWNEDGKCEVLYRGGAGTVLHHSDGTTQTIGNADENIRGGITHTANMTFSNAGEEHLILINGKTGEAYDHITYPLERGNVGDWGDTYGHRSSKYFMGAPYLDGNKPYIFLGRGIYTKIMACTYQVNKSTNRLEKVGDTWQSYQNPGWYGQGNHNFNIADVDEDGADEIVYGSMVLDFHISDKSLHGMSSTSLGHGDAIHTGDLDPYRKGLETFACNEEKPGNNFRNAATCEIYARTVAGSDDGRAMAGNFTDQYPGGIAASTSSGVIPLSKVQANPLSPTYIDGMTNNWNGQTPYPMALNFRLYWDGDLLSETLNGPGSNESYLFVDKLGSRIFDTNTPQWSTACINYTKKNPCASGDILGDWREEIVMRTSDNKALRIYTTNTPTEYRMQSLWYDHQYRQAMVWQTEGYNQPPHPSFFVGQLEGFTSAPPAYTLTGREIVGNKGHVTTAHNGKDVLICPDGNSGTTVAPEMLNATFDAGAQPSTLFLNARTRIEGNDQVTFTASTEEFSRIKLTGSAFTGTMNVCKQGDSAARIPTANHTHTGKTDVWAGALICNGKITESSVWANRFTELFFGNSNVEECNFKSIEMEYGSTLFITNQSVDIPVRTGTEVGRLSVGDLTIKEGSRLKFDLQGTLNADGDQINITNLNIQKRTGDVWEKYGPEYLKPVIEYSGTLSPGLNKIGTIQNLNGSLDDIILVGPGVENAYLQWGNSENGSDKSLYIVKKSGQQPTKSSSITSIDLTNMLPTTAPYYMPEVTISHEGTGSLATRYVSADGTSKIFSGTLYDETYATTDPTTTWSASGATVSKDGTGDVGVRIDLNTSTNSRNAYTLFNGRQGLDFSGVKKYVVELDMCFHAGSDQGSEFALMSKGCVIPTDVNIGYSFIGSGKGYNASGTGYLFFLQTSDRANRVYKINNTETSINMNDWGIHHVKVEIDTEARTAKYTICPRTGNTWNGALDTENAVSGTKALPEGTSAEAYGLFILSGRYSSTNDNPSSTVFRNIKIYSDDTMYSGDGFNHAITNQSGPRSASMTFNGIDWTGVFNYNVEFDLHITPSNDASTQFALTSINTVHGSNTNVDWSTCLFEMVNGGKNSTSWTPAEMTSYTMNWDDTYHYKMAIDVVNRRISYTIYNPDGTVLENNSRALPANASPYAKGIYTNVGRYTGACVISNVKVSLNTSNVFRFTKPGTLEAYMIESGMKPSESKTYTVRAPYAILYQSPAYNEIKKEDVASTLGENLWNSDIKPGRWANWSKTNPKYAGEANYQMVTNKHNPSTGNIYVDKDSVLTTNYIQSDLPLTLVEGFGIGHNGNTEINAKNLGDDNTIVYYKADYSKGGATNYSEGYQYAKADGTYQYTVNGNGTFCKLIAYVPVDEVYTENQTAMPLSTGTGNTIVNRTLSTSQWTPLTLPFSMTTEQIRTTFGPDTKVANLVPDKTTRSYLAFYTDHRVITANTPCLIKVGKQATDNNYVVANVNRTPLNEDPMIGVTRLKTVGTVNKKNVALQNAFIFNSEHPEDVMHPVTESRQIPALSAYFIDDAEGQSPVGHAYVLFDQEPPLDIDLAGRYNIVLLGGNPVTYSDETAKFHFDQELNPDYIQAVKFERAPGTDATYILSVVDVDGNERYLRNTGDGDGRYTLTLTSNDNEALKFKVERDPDYATNGIIYLRNTLLENNYYNKLNNEFRTGLVGDGKGSFVIQPAQKATATLSVTTAKWATFIAPFSVEKPNDVTVYTCNSTQDNNLVLEESDVIEANTPYILYKDVQSDGDKVNIEFTKWGCASKEDYAEGELVGSMVRKYVPLYSYVLQNKNGRVAFYMANSEKVVVSKNRCYIKSQQGSAARPAFYFEDMITSIENVLQDQDADADIIDLYGRKVSKASKGVYIVNGKKVLR